mmetsp:Transcript_61197/g.90828  ORF Transcript_61197/g.90828 Transcript_61197/m.90828 type:complete len:151 (+) Transcript_61197:238-690(+)
MADKMDAIHNGSSDNGLKREGSRRHLEEESKESNKRRADSALCVDKNLASAYGNGEVNSTVRKKVKINNFYESSGNDSDVSGNNSRERSTSGNSDSDSNSDDSYNNSSSSEDNENIAEGLKHQYPKVTEKNGKDVDIHLIPNKGEKIHKV